MTLAKPAFRPKTTTWTALSFACIIAGCVKTLLLFLCAFAAAVGVCGEVDEAFKQRVDAIYKRSRDDGVALPALEQYQKAEGKIGIVIVGDVRRPGIYYLKEGSRVIDVIEAAGGFNLGGCSPYSRVRRRADDGTEKSIILGKDRYVASNIVLAKGDTLWLPLCVL